MKINKIKHITKSGRVKSNPSKIYLVRSDMRGDVTTWKVKVPGKNIEIGPEMILDASSLAKLKESIEENLDQSDINTEIIDIKTGRVVWSDGGSDDEDEDDFDEDE